MKSRPSSILICFTIFLLVSACASSRVSPSDEAPAEAMGPVIPDQSVEEQAVPNENYGPTIPEGGLPPATETAVEVATATATNTEISTSTATATGAVDPPKLCVVLGPGTAKAMAEAAVLATLRKAKVPVHCVVGTEMGAVVGALYSFSNGSTNNLQWQLFKLSKETFFNFPILSLRDPRSTGSKLNEFLRDIFKDKKIEDLPIPFATTAVDEERESAVDLDKGDLADALSASVAVPGIFDPWKAQGSVFHSAALSDPAPIELAKKLGGNFIVLVDVLAETGAAQSVKSRYQRVFAPARSLLKLQKKEASFTILVNTSNILFDDFSRQGEILAAGTAATEKALPELKAAWERWSAGTR
jgi:NTE family protein